MRSLRASKRGALAVAAAFAMLAGLCGCAPSGPVTPLEPPLAAPEDAQVVAEEFVQVLDALYQHFLATQNGAGVISEGATVATAVSELDEAYGLQSQVQAFAAATANELVRIAASTTTAGVPTDVDVRLDTVTAVGRLGARDFATVQVDTEIAHESGPISQERATYALGWSDADLAEVRAYVNDGGTRGLDSGVGLGSATGATGRFLELARDGNEAAIVAFSGGENFYEADLQVLRSLLEANDALTLVELPQFAMGATRLVYALNDMHLVIGRFEVTFGESTSVVYFPTV